MLNLEDPQGEQKVEEVQDKQQIKCIIYYLVKQAGWLLEYNFYKLASHLTNAPKAIANFEHKLKQKEAQTIGTYDNIDQENVDSTSALAPRKRAQCCHA